MPWFQAQKFHKTKIPFQSSLRHHLPQLLRPLLAVGRFVPFRTRHNGDHRTGGISCCPLDCSVEIFFVQSNPLLFHFECKILCSIFFGSFHCRNMMISDWSLLPQMRLWLVNHGQLVRLRWRRRWLWVSPNFVSSQLWDHTCSCCLRRLLVGKLINFPTDSHKLG